MGAPTAKWFCSDPEGRLLSIPRRAAFMSKALAMESGSSFRHNFRRRPKGPASALYRTLSLKGRGAWVVVIIGKCYGQWPCFPAFKQFGKHLYVCTLQARGARSWQVAFFVFL